MIFINHAHEDSNLAALVVDLLETIGATTDQIRCTSQSYLAMPVGEGSWDLLREDLARSSLTIPIITPRYRRSDACMCEAGAIWALEIPTFVVCTPDMRIPQDIPPVFDKQVARLNDFVRLEQLRQVATRALKVDGGSITKWNQVAQELCTIAVANKERGVIKRSDLKAIGRRLNRTLGRSN